MLSLPRLSQVDRFTLITRIAHVDKLLESYDERLRSAHNNAEKVRSGPAAEAVDVCVRVGWGARLRGRSRVYTCADVTAGGCRGGGLERLQGRGAHAASQRQEQATTGGEGTAAGRAEVVGHDARGQGWAAARSGGSREFTVTCSKY